MDVIYSHSDDFCNQNAVARDKRKETSNVNWTPASECFYNCIAPGTGMRLVERKNCPSCNTTINVQACQYTQVPNEYLTWTIFIQGVQRVLACQT